jgi:hypothetical protein
MKDPIKMIEKCRKEEIPFFVLKATDKVAQEAMRHYVWFMHTFKNDISEDYKKEIDTFHKEFVEFEMLNPYKMDLPNM